MIGVLGLGAMGKIIAKDLTENYKEKIVYLVRDVKSIEQFAKEYNAEVRYADVSKPKILVNSFKDLNVVIHAVHHEFNLEVMKACLEANVNYVDLGGLFHYTKKQLKLNKKFKKKNLTAVIGIGASPGITNIMAKYASKKFTKISNIQIKIGYSDFSSYKTESPLSSSYSLQTILEEFSWKPAVYINGKIKFFEPNSGIENYKFPSPIENKKLQYTIHSEIATLPQTLRAKNASFKISFTPEFAEKIITLGKLGFLSEDVIKIKDTKIKSKNGLIQILKKLPKPEYDKINEYEIIRVIIDGIKNNKKEKIIMDAKIEGINETIDKDTGVPPSIVASMIKKGIINKKGVFPPELIVPEEEFFIELAKRKIYIYLNNKRIN